MTEETRRAAVRAAYDSRCGYCTVHESEAGTELEIDHFQPRSAGGSDDLDNLVYCCTACNRLKGDFSNTRMKQTPRPRDGDSARDSRRGASQLVRPTFGGATHITIR